jgi:competence protein ComEA
VNGSHLALALLGLLALAAAPPALAEKKPLVPGERVDVNRAPVAELMRLPGVGRRRAEAIAAHREKQPFRKPEDLLRVKGLSASWLARVKGLLAVGEAPAARPAEPRASR